ncbi:DUF2244 domain-containing protein [Hyphomicrobium sp.]|uniref:DUF2244 domain-containing protein n=1 Tax=Hyphomicrobium sp. TaxID=82 RepID=UPI002E3698C5|nr:DUF2244 domain-containing protein [Hyphomicrobium sp.]HEX2840922.1 DUF2244 domain-containing protein [Hyphomicrobium sp.]
MNDSGQAAHGASVFRAILHPHRSLEPKGFLILMLAIGSVSFVMGMAFLIMGAWPVFGFFGLDVLLVYIAFKLNYRAARAYEQVEISPRTLTLTQVSASGKSRSFEFNPYWVRVVFTERPDGGNHLKLASRGKELEFGRLLNDEERKDFAQALKSALDMRRMSFSA